MNEKNKIEIGLSKLSIESLKHNDETLALQVSRAMTDAIRRFPKKDVKIEVDFTTNDGECFIKEYYYKDAHGNIKKVC